jgi:hypothetical protein
MSTSTMIICTETDMLCQMRVAKTKPYKFWCYHHKRCVLPDKKHRLEITEWELKGRRFEPVRFKVLGGVQK